MQHFRRSAWSNLLKSRARLSSNRDCGVAKCVSDLGLTEAKPDFSTRNFSTLVKKSLAGGKGNGPLFIRQWRRDCTTFARSPFQVDNAYDIRKMAPFFSRTLASSAPGKQGDKSSETRKDISTTEDPFDAPTYNIPEKPVTFTEGASYSIIILAALGVAAAALYGVVKEIILEPKEYKVFNLALKRIQDDDQVRAKIGSPITGYGQESRNRAARQRIPNKVWTDENGVEHVEINCHIRGPHGAGKVYAEMFKDKDDRQWKYTHLVVEIVSPVRTQLILESYLPSLKTT
ncbi:unnamed protein product [Rhodiola kirilowii]